MEFCQSEKVGILSLVVGSDLYVAVHVKYSVDLQESQYNVCRRIHTGSAV